MPTNGGSTHRKTVNNTSKFVHERKNTVFKKAWEYKTGLLNAGVEARIAVLIQVNGKWEIYLSTHQSDWPVDFEVKLHYVSVHARIPNSQDRLYPIGN